ncbi:MAG: cobaltochelatase subunit CobT [Pseudobdellovibrionaceae bacterium]
MAGGNDKEKEKQLDAFKEGVSATIRALSGDKDADVLYKPSDRFDRPKLSEWRYRTKARIPIPSHADLTPEERALIRGTADTEALYLKHHNAKLHAGNRPSDETAAAIFESLEQARFEALGAKEGKGIAQNLNAVLAEHARKQNYAALESKEDIPTAEALYLLAREAFTGEALPQDAQNVVSLWKPYIEARLGENPFAALKETLSSQQDFASALRHVLQKLDYMAAPDDGGQDASDQQADQADTENTPNQPEQQDHEEQQDAQDQVSEDQGDTSPQDDHGEDEEQATSDFEEDGEDTGEGEAAADHEGEIKFAPRNKEAGLKTSYLIYTDQFDEIVKAADLAEPYELSRLRALLDKQAATMQSVIFKLANRLQRKLQARQQTTWAFDLEEGQLDSARLARIVANPTVPLTFKQERQTEFRDTVVTLLLDNSGSMRGRPITIAALCTDILAKTLERCQVKVEILGFTTRAWKGGKSRDMWMQEGRPTLPGRLNDLRHIIYKSADQPWRRVKNNLGLMLKEGLLKENIDGEAIVWAHNRLAARPEKRKILIVISDGAPVDDSTLSVNPSNILEADLQNVVNWIENRSDIEIAAIGIGHDVTRHYKRAIKITDASDLGEALIHQLDDLFDL